MRTYREYLHNLFQQVNEDILDMLEKDEAYSQLITELSKYQEQLEQARKHHNQDITELINNMRSTETKMNMREKEEMYIKGYKDCIKFMGIING